MVDGDEGGVGWWGRGGGICLDIPVNKCTKNSNTN